MPEEFQRQTPSPSPAASFHTLMEVVELSATNLPNVRRIPGGRTRPLVRLEGPLRAPFETDEDAVGGFSPKWDTPFTVALHSLQPELKISVYTKRTGRSNKLIGSATASLSDFDSVRSANGKPVEREYVLDCPYGHRSDLHRADGDGGDLPKIKISLWFIGRPGKTL